jgi:hypothetical protein
MGLQLHTDSFPVDCGRKYENVNFLACLVAFYPVNVNVAIEPQSPLWEGKLPE